MSKETSGVPAKIDSQTPAPATNWPRVGVKIIPYIGSSLDELFYGRGEEARWRRVEGLLTDLGEAMKQRGITAEEIEKEDFGGLLGIVGPVASRSTSEEKRRMLRNLLLNAVTVEAGSATWESARLAAELIADLEAPALAIISGLDRLGACGDTRADLALAKDGAGGQLRLKADDTALIEIDFDWLVVDHEYKKISSEPRLVKAGSHPEDRYEGIALTRLGEFLVKWARSAPEV